MDYSIKRNAETGMIDVSFSIDPNAAGKPSKSNEKNTILGYLGNHPVAITDAGPVTVSFTVLRKQS